MNRTLWAMALVACAVASAHAQQLYSNGDFNNVGDSSQVEVSGGANGFNTANGTPFRVADNFTVPPGESWTLSEAHFFAYEPNSGTTPSINGAFVTIYRNGPPASGSVVWGNFTSNIFNSASFTGVYRRTFGTTTGTTRPIMQVYADLAGSPKLGPGTYWIAWSLTGTVGNGPWQIPVRPTPGGANAQQFSGGSWSVISDASSGREMAFRLWGTRTTHGAVYAAQNGGSRLWGYWRTNGGSFVNWARVFNSGVPSGWDIVGFGDIDNDGRGDAVLRNQSTGRLACWTLIENQIQVWSHLANLPLSFKFVGLGDANGDGYDDIFVQNISTREVGVHLLGAGFAVGAFQPLSVIPDGETTTLGVGDLSGDGLADVLFDNGKGRLGYWTITGTTTVAGWTLIGFTSANWSVVGLTDMNQDDQPDIVVKVPSKNQVGFFPRTSATTLGGYTKSGNVNLATTMVLGVGQP